MNSGGRTLNSVQGFGIPERYYFLDTAERCIILDSSFQRILQPCKSRGLLPFGFMVFWSRIDRKNARTQHQISVSVPIRIASIHCNPPPGIKR